MRILTSTNCTDMNHESLPSDEYPHAADVLGLYDPPKAIVLDKVLAYFDKHATNFIEASTFVAGSLRTKWGEPVPLLVGGLKGFARVVDLRTVEIDTTLEDWPGDQLLQPAISEWEAGFLFIIPGVKETLRVKGMAAATTGLGRSGGGVLLRVTLDNTFFHCAKAFIRSRLWEPPSSPTPWTGLRPFRCIRKERESETITSFYLCPVDGGTVPIFRPGQHVMVQMTRPGHDKPVRRTYSLSNRPGDDALRISVKREAGPAFASAHLHDHVAVDDILHLYAPAGSFVLDEDSTRPVVLLSAGVGLTPVVSMLEHLAATGSTRKVWYIHAARSGREHAMSRHVREIARDRANIHIHVCYGSPAKADVEGRDFDSSGRISIGLLKKILPLDDCEFYLCGPGGFMSDLVASLGKAGVQPDRIRWEAFGGAAPAVVEATLRRPRPGVTQVLDAAGATIEFHRSGKTVAWPSGCASLLDLAEANGIPVRSSCRTGQCFTCTTRVLAGEVIYVRELEDEPEPGTALICSALPLGSVVLDL